MIGGERYCGEEPVNLGLDAHMSGGLHWQVSTALVLIEFSSQRAFDLAMIAVAATFSSYCLNDGIAGSDRCVVVFQRLAVVGIAYS